MTFYPPALMPNRTHNLSLTNYLPEGKFRSLIMYRAYESQVDPDMVLVNVLIAINSAMNGKLFVHNGNHPEVVQSNFIWVADPSERKSSTVSFSTRPLVDWYRQRDANPYFGDVSGTALVEFLAENDGLGCYHEPEAELLEMVCGGHLKPQILCKLYDGEAIRLKRARKKLIDMAHPAAVLGVGTQPKFAYRFGRHPGVRASGLLSRFWIITFPSRAGWREVGTPPLPAEMQEFYNGLITRLLEFSPPPGRRHELSLDAAAQAKFMDFACQVEHELRPDGLLHFDKGWGGKLTGKTLRLGALLHCITHERFWDVPIDLNTINQAIAMAIIFVDHAKQYFFMMEHGGVLDVAEAIMKQAVPQQPFATFTLQDVRNALPEYSNKMISAGLDKLLKSGDIYEDLERYAARATRGRPKGPRYRLSRAAWRYTP